MELHDTDVSLPLDTSKRIHDTSHVVMLYNDESHSYDEVMTTLTEAVKCTRPQAYQFAAVVDKEGRSSIYCGEEKDCSEVVSECMRLTSKNNSKPPLKCKSMDFNVVAHQIIALDLMTWITEVVDMSDGLRRLLCLLTTGSISGLHQEWSLPFLETIIKQDTSLWKVARARSHQLFMNNILLDVYGRKNFAITFAKCYKLLIGDFLADDHEHEVSVASLSVQIFTVPSLATMLILDGNILKTCLSVFLEKLQPAKGKHGCLDFQEGISGLNISRANFILNDTIYLLRQKPIWTPEFSNSFLEAFEIFVEILKLMQGMDSVTRKTQQHIAYEPNWEPAFTLQLGMVPVIRLMLTWCCSEASILKSATHSCVFALRSLQSLKYTTVKGKTVVNHDVTSKSTSFHFALSRFLAGLLAGASKFGLNLYDLLSIEPNPDEGMIKLQLQILEYPLRSLVLSAQVNAQMWKRNGYAMQHQHYCYHNNRFVSEMADKDVLLVQVLAAVMNPDHFINAILHKYNLRSWSKGKHVDEKDKDKDAAEKESIIAKEFLLLIFHTLTERFQLGVSSVTTTQILERELIHRLSLGPIARSLVIKMLPFKDSDEEEDCPFEEIVDDVLKEVAVYREPGNIGKGVFELKEDYLARCTRYFMHFTKSEETKMVEEQRRILKKSNKEPSYYLYTPPKFTNNFQNVLKILGSHRLLKTLRTVFSIGLKGEHGYEDHIGIALLIIAVGLIETKRHREEHVQLDLDFVSLLSQEQGNERSISHLLDDLLNSNDTKDYYQVGKWVKQLFQKELEHSSTVEMEIDSEIVETVSENKDESTVRAEKARIASEQKRKMMEQINQMQKAFIQSHSKFFEIPDSEEEAADQPLEEEDSSYPVAIGNKKSSVEDEALSILCILCQDKEPIGGENFFVATSFINRSRLAETCSEEGNAQFMPELTKPNMLNVSSCGHVVHIQCWEKYYSSVSESDTLLFQRRLKSNIDSSQDEYLCPLCKSLCNSVLPLLPRVSYNVSSDDNASQDMSIGEILAYLEKFSVEMSNASKHSAESATLQATDDSDKSTIPVFNKFSPDSEQLPPGASSDSLMALFAKRVMKVYSRDMETKPSQHSLPYLWMTCSFTLQAYECSSRMEGINVFSTLSERQDQFLRALVQYLANFSVVYFEVYEPLETFSNVLFNFFCSADSELSILEGDIFGIMISLRLVISCIQNIFPDKEPKLVNTSTSLIDDVVFKICLLANLVKIYLTVPALSSNIDKEDLENITEEENVVKSWRYIQHLVGNDNTGQVDSSDLKNHVIQSLLPFMRCSAIFFHYLTGVKFPDTLSEEFVYDEMKLLLKYLNCSDDIEHIFSPDIFTSDSSVKTLLERWCSHKNVLNRTTAKITPHCFMVSRNLVPLPKDYSTLINRVSGFMCPTFANDSSRSPALCLICDKIFCSQCHCCVTEEPGSNRRIGACSKHAIECGAGIGIFLHIRDCQVLLTHNHSKGLFLPAPYLDEYGETDNGLNRGNPLFLNEGRYRNLQQLWLRQKIPETVGQSMGSKNHPSFPNTAILQNWYQI